MFSVISASDVRGPAEKTGKNAVFAATEGRRLKCNYVIISPGQKSDLHSHESDQVNYILSGKGYLVGENEEIAVSEGMAVYIDGNVKHTFRCSGDAPLVTIGIIGPES